MRQSWTMSMGGRRAGPVTKSRKPRPQMQTAPPLRDPADSGRAILAHLGSSTAIPTRVRSLPVITLQRLAGNAAVAAALGGGRPARSIVVQRNGTKTAKRGAKAAGGPRPLWRDVRTATLDELTTELKAVNDELFRTSMKTQRGQELFSTRRMLMKEIDRRQQVPRIDAVRRDLDLLARRQESVLDAARFTHQLATDHFLGPFERDMTSYVERYTQAYNKVDAALKKAKADEERWQKIHGALLGVAIGTGVGLAANAIWESARGLKKIAVEVGGEVAEWILGQGASLITPQPSNWDLPTSMHPQVLALAQTTKLLQAWKGVALVQATSMDVVTIQKAIRAQDRTLDTIEGELTLRDIESRVQALKARDPARAMIEKLLEVRAGMHALRNAAEYGITRSQYRLEQDLWIAWIKSLGPSPDNYRGFHEALRDVWDQVEDAGVVHRLGLEDRQSDIEGAPDAAARDEQARKNLDRLAVVIAPSGTKGEAVVRLRHDAYQGAPQQDPDPNGDEPYLRVRSTTSGELTAGQVVKIHDVLAGQAQIFGTGWGTRPVSQAEVTYARSMMAINAL